MLKIFRPTLIKFIDVGSSGNIPRKLLQKRNILSKRNMLRGISNWKSKVIGLVIEEVQTLMRNIQ